MKEAIIIFTRVPIPGKTKTRLEKCLSPIQCAELHSSFLKDIARECRETNKNIFVFYTPEGNKGILLRLIGNIGEYHVQTGEDLGEKMLKSIEYVIGKGYDSCVLIGTDVPQLKSRYLLEAFNILKTHDVVLGPTYDKGYYLVGMKKPHREVFSNQKYGSGDVLSNTINQIKNSGLRVSLGAACMDIDEKEDLIMLEESINNGETTHCHYTIEFLKELKVSRKERNCSG